MRGCYANCSKIRLKAVFVLAPWAYILGDNTDRSVQCLGSQWNQLILPTDNAALGWPAGTYSFDLSTGILDKNGTPTTAWPDIGRYGISNPVSSSFFDGSASGLGVIPSVRMLDPLDISYLGTGTPWEKLQSVDIESMAWGQIKTIQFPYNRFPEPDSYIPGYENLRGYARPNLQSGPPGGPYTYSPSSWVETDSFSDDPYGVIDGIGNLEGGALVAASVPPASDYNPYRSPFSSMHWFLSKFQVGLTGYSFCKTITLENLPCGQAFRETIVPWDENQPNCSWRLDKGGEIVITVSPPHAAGLTRLSIQPSLSCTQAATYRPGDYYYYDRGKCFSKL